METISQGLMAKLGVNMSGFRRGLGKAVSDARKAGTRINAGFAKIGRGVKRATIAVVAFAAAGAALTIGFTRSVIRAADTSEQFRLRLNAMLGSVEEGAKTFELMNKFAANSPFEFEQVMASATQLAGIVKGGSAEIAQLMPMISDLAAVSGLSIQQTTDQIVRSFSAGIGAADLFRDRGTSAMLGFQAGVKVSAADTRRQIINEWEKTGSQFRGLSEELATTWTGITGMLRDRWFQFKNLVADAGLFDLAKQAASGLVEKLNELADTGRLNDFAQTVSDTIVTLVNSTVRGIGFVGQKLIATVEFFRSIQFTAEFGLIGLVFFGRKGALAAGAIGAVIDLMRDKLALGLNSATEIRAEIARAEAALEQLVQGGGGGTLSGRGRTQALQRRIERLKGELAALGPQAQTTLETINDIFASFEDFNLESLFGGAVAGAGQLNEEVRILHSGLLGVVTLSAEHTAEIRRAQEAWAEGAKDLLEWQQRLDRIGETIQNQLIGGIGEVLLQLDDVLGTVKSIGRAILREIVANLARAAAAGQSLGSVLSVAGPLGIVGAGIGIISQFFDQGGVVQPQRLAMAGGGGVPVVAHPGEVVLSRQAVSRLGGPTAANQLNQGVSAGGGVTFVFDPSRLPPATNPLAAARDGDWIEFFTDSIAAWEQNGGSFS
ncbi:MAG: hypothetical protein V3T08_09530 [Gemmatimonadota bacterium]